MLKEIETHNFKSLRHTRIPLQPLSYICGPNASGKTNIAEGRNDCCGELADQGLKIIHEECEHCLGGTQVAVVVSNRAFECLLFADYAAVDKLEILKKNVSQDFPDTTDERNVISWLQGAFKPGYNYDKKRDGKYLAKSMNLSDLAVIARNRSLRKLLKELPIEV
jgi:hypothetical protein